MYIEALANVKNTVSVCVFSNKNYKSIIKRDKKHAINTMFIINYIEMFCLNICTFLPKNNE